MSPVDSNGRDRVFEIQDILHTINSKIPNFKTETEDSLVVGGVILALLELYNLNRTRLY